MRIYFSYTFILLVTLFATGCKKENNPTNEDKPIRTVEYYAFITPNNSAVSKNFTYTNENGGLSQSGSNGSRGEFTKTVQLKSGTFVQLKAVGSTTQNLNIGGRVIIFVNGDSVAESNASDNKYNNTVEVSLVIP